MPGFKFWLPEPQENHILLFWPTSSWQFGHKKLTNSVHSNLRLGTWEALLVFNKWVLKQKARLLSSPRKAYISLTCSETDK